MNQSSQTGGKVRLMSVEDVAKEYADHCYWDGVYAGIVYGLGMVLVGIALSNALKGK